MENTIRDKRQPGWFYVDNKLLTDGYSQEIGPIGIAIYICLCKHADNDKQACFPSQKKIADEIGVGTRTVINYLKKLEKLQMIQIHQSRDKNKKHVNNVYYLLHKDKWEKPGAGDAHGNKLQSEKDSSLILEDADASDSTKKEEPCAGDAPTHVQEMHTNYTHRTRPIKPPLYVPPKGDGTTPHSKKSTKHKKSFNMDEYIIGLLDHNNYLNKFIGWFFRESDIQFISYEEANKFLRANLKWAEQLLDMSYEPQFYADLRIFTEERMRKMNGKQTKLMSLRTLQKFLPYFRQDYGGYKRVSPQNWFMPEKKIQELKKVEELVEAGVV